MGELIKVFLRPDVPLTPVERSGLMGNLHEQAAKGFKVEVGREVIAHAPRGGSASFTVERIEPPNKFYGMVDGDTEFIMLGEGRAEEKPPPPTLAGGVSTPFPDEANTFISLVDDLEAVRGRHNISWGTIHKAVEAIDRYSEETAPRA